MSLDSVLLLFAIYDWSLLDGFGRKEPEWHIYLFPYLIHPLKSMTGTACVYMVVAVAAERYHAICHPLKYKPSPCTYIIMVLLIAFLVNVSKFFEFKLATSEKENSTELVYTTTELNEQASYVVFSSYHECLIGEVLPLLALCILNFQISIKIWNSGKMNHRHLGPTKSDFHTEDEVISNYNSPSLHSSTKRPNGRQVILETSFRANGGQRVDLHRSQSTFLTPRQSRTCRGATPVTCSHSTRPLAGLEDSVSEHQTNANGQAVPANSNPNPNPMAITGSHLTSISLHSSCLFKRKSIKSSEKRFQNRREKSIGILVCIITIFFACHLFQVGIQIFQICLPGHGLKDYYKECEQQKRSHVPAIIYTLGFTNRLLLVVNSSVNFLIYCIMAKRFRSALVKLLHSMRKRLFRGNCEFV
ncbi:uncharacterized protein LOC131879707 [Tigriopus californicus]|uniref:uncharacterized protein LOC131879707 n=1 Tax=Tigriopus californicus TaxID=6832 RepID=UPI0027DA0D1C|nr:uncharacterized protein LOC131879707 [Tigriopus californicus]